MAVQYNVESSQGSAPAPTTEAAEVLNKPFTDRESRQPHLDAGAQDRAMFENRTEPRTKKAESWWQKIFGGKTRDSNG